MGYMGISHYQALGLPRAIVNAVALSLVLLALGAAAQKPPGPITPKFNGAATHTTPSRPPSRPPEPPRPAPPRESPKSIKEPFNANARRPEPAPRRIEPAPRTAGAGAARTAPRLTPEFSKQSGQRFTQRSGQAMVRAERARTSQGLPPQMARKARALSNRQINLVTAKSQQYMRQGQRPVILGASGIYRPLAKKTGGSNFSSATGDFAYAASRRGAVNVKTQNKVWARNQAYMDRAIAGGTPILLGTPASLARKGGGYSRELAYLRNAVRNSNGSLQYVKAPVKLKNGRSKQVIIGVESARPPAATPAPAPRPPTI